MKTKIITSVVVAALLASGVSAQDSTPASASPNHVVTPTTPAPAVAPAAAPAPNQIVYTPRLPGASELTNAAAAQGLTIERIEQSASQIVAVYKNASGQTNTVAYQALPPATAPAPAPTTPPPALLYAPAPRVVYYDSYDPFYYSSYPYYPRVWYPPVSLRLGFGFGHRGGFHHRH